MISIMYRNNRNENSNEKNDNNRFTNRNNRKWRRVTE